MSILRTTFQVLVTVCLLILAAAAVLLISRLLHWPLATVGWGAAAVVLVVLAVRFGPGLWRKLLAARTVPSPTNAAAAQRVAALREKWKGLIGQLRGSRLGARAVDALPWFLMLGDEGAGKTAALKNCRRSVALPAAATSGGQECRLEWALLEGAVVLDVPASCLRPTDEADRAEWAELLSLVARTRGGGLLDGVVLTVAADTLLRKSAEELKADAAVVRQRLDEAIRRLGVRFPVYVLVTRWDKVEGMARFFQCLPPKAWEQPVGAVVATGQPAGAVAESVVDRLAARLADLRLSILADARYREFHRQALLFPEEAGTLRGPLATYLGALFTADVYRESAALRGIYFSSARQEGKGTPGLLSRLGFPEEELSAAPEDRSLFLSGFFGEVITGDRGLAAPTSRALTLRSLTRNAGLTAWVTVCLLLAIVLTASFTRNLTVLRDVSRTIPSGADLKGRVDTDLRPVDLLRASAVRLREQNSGWGLGRILLPQLRRAEEGLWAEHDRRFRKALLDPLDRAFDGRLDRLLAGGSAEELAAAVDLLVKRVNLLKVAAAEARPLEELAKMEQPSYAWFLGAPDRDTLVVFHRNYVAHLGRGPKSGVLPAELSAQEALLRKVLGRDRAALDWVVDWANLQADVRPVKLEDFWGSGVPANAETGVVAGAFTPAGWAKIQGFLEKIATASQEGGAFAKARGDFEASYRKTYFSQWERFLLGFSKGDAAWPGLDRKVELATRFGGRESPYAKLLAALPDAIKPAVDLSGGRSELPGWVPLAYRYDRLRQPTYQEVLKRSQGALGTAAAKGTQVLGKLWEKIEGGGREDATLAEDVRAFPYWTAYQDALVKSAERVRSSSASYQLARDVFAEADLSVGEPQQSVSRLFWSVQGLKKSLGKETSGEEVYWQLLTRQADQLWAAILGQAELSIEKAWEGDVLGAAAGLTGVERVEALQGPNGKVWEFQDKVLSPFVTKTFRRPQPRTAYGGSLRFSAAFLDLMGRGKVGQQAIRGASRVQISALPTDANPEATVKPHMTRLLLQCGSGSQELVNQNYPVGKTFNWSPEDCADTTLEIGVGNTVLKRWYSGPEGFSKFLGEFRGGRKVFRSTDFPEQQSVLARYRIEAITVNYAFRGQEGVLGSAATAAPRVPERIFP